MNKQDFTRTLIELAVDQGMKGMKENPHRSIRRMADLGRQFSKGRFQEQIFTLFQKLLTNENSPYYDIMANLFDNVDEAALKRFGINIGYNAWTWGACQIRKKEQETGTEFPWLLKLVWSPSSQHGLSLAEINALVTGNRKNGVYAYWIPTHGSLAGNTEIFSVFRNFPDCIFILDLTESDCRLTAAQLAAIKECPNTALLLPSAKDGCLELSGALKAQKSLYAVSLAYSDRDIENILTGKWVYDLLPFGSKILCMTARPDCSGESRKKAGDFALAARLNEKYPAILIDWFADIDRVQKIISTPLQSDLPPYRTVMS